MQEELKRSLFKLKQWYPSILLKLVPFHFSEGSKNNPLSLVHRWIYKIYQYLCVCVWVCERERERERLCAWKKECERTLNLQFGHLFLSLLQSWVNVDPETCDCILLFRNLWKGVVGTASGFSQYYFWVLWNNVNLVCELWSTVIENVIYLK